MASGRADVSRQLQTLFTLGTAGALTDGELLERFASRRGTAAEMAFAALVERHGPVVLRVCRDILSNPADAEDAFQATFLVLVHRAGSIRNRDSVASWLYGVALRVAGCARSSRSRRRVHEQKAAERTADLIEGSGDDLGPVLHEEVGRLPEKYRAAVVLCYWEGLTHEQAADRLHWPVGTVRSRLSWARQRLRARLTRRGLAPAVALAGVEASRSALAVPETLLQCTVQSGLLLAAGQAPAGVVSAAAGVLTKGVIRTMMIARWKMTALALLTVGLMAAGAGGIALQARDGEPPNLATKGAPAEEGFAGKEPEIDQKVDLLKDYLRELRVKVEQREKDWVDLTEKSIVDLIATPHPMLGRVTLDEYKQVREELFRTNMKLIETEALFKNRQDEIKALYEGVDPDSLLQKRIKDALRKDPEIASLMKEIDQAQRKFEMAVYRARSQADPSLIQSRRQAETMKQDFRALVARKQEALTAQFRKTDEESFRELKAQTDSLKVRKAAYEKLLSQLDVTNKKQGTDPAKAASIREDLAGLRGKEAFVKKWIEQLQDEARAARPR